MTMQRSGLPFPRPRPPVAPLTLRGPTLLRVGPLRCMPEGPVHAQVEQHDDAYAHAKAGVTALQRLHRVETQLFPGGWCASVGVSEGRAREKQPRGNRRGVGEERQEPTDTQRYSAMKQDASRRQGNGPQHHQQKPGGTWKYILAGCSCHFPNTRVKGKREGKGEGR